MIKGLSFQNGVFFIGRKYVSCAFIKNGKKGFWIEPLTGSALLKVISTVIIAMPMLFKLFSIVSLSLIFIPKYIDIGWNGLPYYFIFYYTLGTHFFFPVQLRKFHGAEHKVFSYPGSKTLSNLNEIKAAQITNRYCSTNLVVVYFHCVLITTYLLSHIYSIDLAVAYASYGSLLLAPLLNSQLNRSFFAWIKKYVLTVSYYLQKKITTAEPDDEHLFTAIRSYRGLLLREFPSQVRKELLQRKENSKLAIVDITIIPLGTNDPSVSEYIAEIHQVLKNYEDKVTYQLTPMSTIIEGKLEVLFEVVQALHEVPFNKGAKRVTTNIRIDDRRDKQLTMAGKLKSVESKLEAIEEKEKNNLK